MSKKSSLQNGPMVPPSSMAYMYWPWMMQDLEGQVLTAIESFGLRETQEKAAKDVIRSYLYRFYDKVKYISPEVAETILKNNENMQQGGTVGSK